MAGLEGIAAGAVVECLVALLAGICSVVHLRASRQRHLVRMLDA